MRKLAWETSFRTAFKRRTRNNPALQDRVFEALSELMRDPFSPFLKTHKINALRIANFKSDIPNPQCPSSSEISAVFDSKGIRVYTGNALGDHSGVLKICLGRLCLK